MRLLTLSICVLIIGLSGAAADAAPLTLTPVGIELKSGQRTTVLVLHSNADQPVAIQARTFLWTQKDGADVLEPTREIIISPPLATVPPNSDQILRLVRLGADTPTHETSYRVLVDELPPPVTAGQGTNVTLLTRQSVPVFVEPPTPGKPDLAVSIDGIGSERRLILTNSGGRRIRLADVALGDGAGGTLERDGGLYGYVLSGSSLMRPLRTAKAPAVFSAVSDLGPIGVPVVGPSVR